MKKTITLKNILFKAVFAYLLVAGTSLYAQRDFTFTVNSPAAIAGEYDVLHATFGPICTEETTTGDLELALQNMDPDSSLLCDGMDNINDLTGNIALLDRGNCDFAIKVFNAQENGAIAVIVCTNTADPIFNMGAGMNSELVTIPSVMMSMDDCATIRAEIPNGTVNVTLEPVLPVIPPDTDIIYYEEDFAAGPNGWTSETPTNEADEIWYWDEQGTFPNAFGGNVTISLPESSCGGAMGFPSGYYQTGMTGDVGQIPATYTDYNGELISPTLDLSAVSDALSLKFTQRISRLNPNTGAGFCFASYSIDGGATWSELIPINEDVPINSADTPNPPTENTVKVAIPEINGEPNVKIKLTWQCDFYYWIVDNIKLVKRADSDLAVMENFYAIAPNAWTPLSQAEPFSFLADITNQGATVQPNTVLNVTITDDSGAEVHNVDLDYGDVVPDSTYENVPFDVMDSFTPGALGEYDATYSISSDSMDFEFTPEDNSIDFSFIVTDSIFSKEFEPATAIRPADSNWDAGELHSWSYGNYYHIVNGSDAGDAWFASEATFGVEGANAGEFVSIYLYKITGDATNVGNIDPDERVRVGSATYVTTGNEVGTDMITLQLSPQTPDDGTPGRIILDSDTGYALMVEFESFTATSDLEITAGEGLNYQAQVFRTNQDFYTDVPYRPADLLAIGSADDVAFDAGGFTNFVPAVRLHLTNADIVSTTELDPANIVNIMPNPANDYLNLQMDLVNAQDEINVNIVDVTGKTIQSNVYNNVSNETIRFDISKLAAGAYFLNLVTEEGVRTERFIIQR